MAALLERSGTYYAQFYDETRSPQRKRFSLKTTRKRTAQKILIQFEDDYLQGEFDPWTDDPWSYDDENYESYSVRTAMDRFLDRKREDGRAANTIRTYREILGLLISKVGGEVRLEQVSSKHIRDFVRESSLAKATQRKRFGHLRTFFRWCKKENLLRKSPLQDVEPPEKPNKLPKAITQEELETLCVQIRSDYERLREKNWIREGQNIWRIPLFWFAFYTGMRGSELARLRWKHIDFDKGLIYIREQKNRKEQTIPLNSKAREVLEQVERGDPDDYVFQSPSFEGKDRNPKWFRENVSEAFRTARKDAGLKEGLSFHSPPSWFLHAVSGSRKVRSGDQGSGSSCGHLNVHAIRAHGKRATEGGGRGGILSPYALGVEFSLIRSQSFRLFSSLPASHGRKLDHRIATP